MAKSKRKGPGNGSVGTRKKKVCVCSASWGVIRDVYLTGRVCVEIDTDGASA